MAETNRTKRTMRTYTEEYRKQAISLAGETGPKKAAIELGISESTLSGWIHRAKNGDIDMGAGSRTPEASMNLAEEVKALREQNKKLAKETRN